MASLDDLEARFGEASIDDVEAAGASVESTDGDDEPPLDASELEAVRRCAAASGEPLLVVLLVGCVGAGKSATANRLVGQPECRPSKRSACGVTRSCGVAAGAGVLVVDTPGFGDPSLAVNAHVATIRRALEAVEGAAVEAAGRAPTFATLYVCSVAARVTESDAAAWEALRFALGRAWRRSAVLVWTHADLLEANTLGDFLDGLEDHLKAEVDAFAGGKALLDNATPGPSADALVAEVLERARRWAGPRPQPRGKHARRIRQDAARVRAARRRRENGGVALHAADDDPGRCVLL